MENKKYTAMDIANYIVNYVIESELGVLTPLKLQNLYYVSTTYLKETGNFLFNESFEKWQYGPVVTSVYHNFKGFGINHIHSPVPTIEVDSQSFLGSRRLILVKIFFRIMPIFARLLKV